MARMSAQDTTPGHLLSIKVLAFFMVSNPSTLRYLLLAASFSARILLPGLDIMSMDASQPFIHPMQIIHQSIKHYKQIQIYINRVKMKHN